MVRFALKGVGFFMAPILTIVGIVLLWNAGLADWIVAYATGVAQLGIWLTLLSLIPFTTLWVTYKRSPFLDQPSSQTRAHWSVLLKVSLVFCAP